MKSVLAGKEQTARASERGADSDGIAAAVDHAAASPDNAHSTVAAKCNPGLVPIAPSLGLDGRNLVDSRFAAEGEEGFAEVFAGKRR